MRPAPNELPGHFETGSQNHESIAGVLGAIEYLQWVGQNFGGDFLDKYAGRFSGRRLALKVALTAIRAYEFEVSRAILGALGGIPGLRVYGLEDVRVPTFAFTLEGRHPRQVAERLAAENIYVWDGNYYAINVTERLGVEDKGDMVRVGPVHYNTLEEVGRLREVLWGLV